MKRKKNEVDKKYFLFGGIISDPSNIFHMISKYNTHYVAFTKHKIFSSFLHVMYIFLNFFFYSKLILVNMNIHS